LHRHNFEGGPMGIDPGWERRALIQGLDLSAVVYVMKKDSMLGPMEQYYGDIQGREYRRRRAVLLNCDRRAFGMLQGWGSLDGPYIMKNRRAGGVQPALQPGTRRDTFKFVLFVMGDGTSAFEWFPNETPCSSLYKFVEEEKLSALPGQNYALWVKLNDNFCLRLERGQRAIGDVVKSHHVHLYQKAEAWR
jgi:hypothetical protein